MFYKTMDINTWNLTRTLALERYGISQGTDFYHPTQNRTKNLFPNNYLKLLDICTKNYTYNKITL